MNHYVVVAETGADIPQRFVDELDLRIVPMHVQFGGESHDDGQFPASVVFDHYKKTGELPKTSGCTPADFDTAFSKIYKEDPDAKVVYLAYSSVTTCSYQSARSVSAAYPPMISLDTKQVTAGQFLVVTEVARYIKNNPDCTENEVRAFAQNCIDRTHMAFIPGELEFLHAGGRLSNAAFLGASRLKIKPTIEIIDGKLVATKKRRGTMEKCVNSLLTDFLASENWDRSRVAMIRSEGLSQEIQDMVQQRLEEEGFKEITWIDTGCVISSHCGPGSFGISAFRA